VPSVAQAAGSRPNGRLKFGSRSPVFTTAGLSRAGNEQFGCGWLRMTGGRPRGSIGVALRGRIEVWRGSRVMFAVIVLLMIVDILWGSGVRGPVAVDAARCRGDRLRGRVRGCGWDGARIVVEAGGWS